MRKEAKKRRQEDSKKGGKRHRVADKTKTKSCSRQTESKKKRMEEYFFEKINKTNKKNKLKNIKKWRDIKIKNK